jgi:hypothetical protein
LAFPNATVHVGKADVEFFQDRSNAAKAHYGMNYFDDYFTSLKHYVDAGKVQTFEGTTVIVPAGTGYEWVPNVYGNRDTSKKWQ